MGKILIIEDDIYIADIERDFLLVSSFEVDVSNNGTDGLKKALEGEYDLILLDVMLPGINGYDICNMIRDKLDIPILMVTAKTDDYDKIKGLGLGADDYIEKPFSPSVLVAKVKSNLAQYNRLKKKDETQKDTLKYGDIEINIPARRVFVKGREVKFKNKEFEMLAFFMTNYDIVFTRDQLYENIWGSNALGDNATVAVHVNRVREKIEDDLNNPKYIRTVWGAGYKFSVSS